MSDELRHRRMEALRAQLGKEGSPEKPTANSNDDEKILTDETKEAVLAASKVAQEKTKEGIAFLKRATEKAAEVAKEKLTKKIVEEETQVPAVEVVLESEPTPAEEPAQIIEVVEQELEVSSEPDPQAHVYEDLVAFIPQPEPEPQETPTEPAAEEPLELHVPIEPIAPLERPEATGVNKKVVAGVGAGVLLVLAFGTWIFVKPDAKTTSKVEEVQAAPAVSPAPQAAPTPIIDESTPEPVKAVESVPEVQEEVVPDPVPVVKETPAKVPEIQAAPRVEKPKKVSAPKPVEVKKPEPSWQDKANADLDNLLKD